MPRMAKRGRSIEAEGAESAESSVAAVQATVDRLYGKRKPKHVVEDLIAERRRESRKE